MTRRSYSELEYEYEIDSGLATCPVQNPNISKQFSKKNKFKMEPNAERTWQQRKGENDKARANKQTNQDTNKRTNQRTADQQRHKTTPMEQSVLANCNQARAYERQTQ